jgi:hypothetical protein
LIAIVRREQRIVVTWCWELYFSLLCIVPENAKERIVRVMAADLAWLKPLMRLINIDQSAA